MADDSKALHERLDAIERQVAALQRGRTPGIRKRAARNLWGLPLYDIALGPDPKKDERWGHARGFFAIGDCATGVIAIGGVARGVIAVGGIALGIVCLGGCSFGILMAIGGVALAGFAFGGVAVGVIAVGGVAVGYYACGGAAVGRYVISAMKQSGEAIDFFAPWLPGLRR